MNSTRCNFGSLDSERWAVCGGGNRGGSQSNPAESGGDAFENGQQTSGTVWVTNCYLVVEHFNLSMMQLMTIWNW